MRRVAQICAEFHKSSDLVVVDVEDGLSQSIRPESGGLRACLVYFYHVRDRNKHVCEAEITHARSEERDTRHINISDTPPPSSCNLIHLNRPADSLSFGTEGRRLPRRR